MAKLDPPSDRFRSATEFPKTIQALDRPEADALYEEMRNCLIFTNRSRAQLVRRNQEYKDKTGLLKEDVQRLQSMIQKLAVEKQQTLQEKESIISDLETEMTKMASHLDELSVAFDAIADVETAEQTQWSFVALPGRFFRFVKAVRAVVSWWRSDRPDDLPPASAPTPAQPTLGPSEAEDEDEDRFDRPQMYTDQASINRSLLDR
ncbi:MAG TPA: hypothetical protein V6D29_09410 [Leptolyngbyaceae cyanobacterium]